jgi:hypothetical protein
MVLCYDKNHIEIENLDYVLTLTNQSEKIRNKLENNYQSTKVYSQIGMESRLRLDRTFYRNIYIYTLDSYGILIFKK